MRYLIARFSKTEANRIAIVPDLTVPVGKTVTPMQFDNETDALLRAIEFKAATGDEFFALPCTVPTPEEVAGE